MADYPFRISSVRLFPNDSAEVSFVGEIPPAFAYMTGEDSGPQYCTVLSDIPHNAIWTDMIPRSASVVFIINLHKARAEGMMERLDDPQSIFRLDDILALKELVGA